LVPKSVTLNDPIAAILRVTCQLVQTIGQLSQPTKSNSPTQDPHCQWQNIAHGVALGNRAPLYGLWATTRALSALCFLFSWMTVSSCRLVMQAEMITETDEQANLKLIFDCC